MNSPYKPYIHRGRSRGYREFPSYDNGRGSYRQRSNDGIKGGYSPTRPKSRGYNTLQGSYTWQDNYNDRSDRRQPRFRSPSRFPAKRSKVAFRSPNRDKDRCFSCRQLNHLAREYPEKNTSVAKVQPREQTSPGTKTVLRCMVVTKKKKMKKN